MRFFYKPILLIPFILSVSCGENDIEKTILFTYEKNSPDDYGLVILTDTEGNLLDSASTANSPIIELEGPAGTENYTFTRVSARHDFIQINSYFHTNAKSQTLNYNNRSEGAYVTLNISDNLRPFRISGHSDRTDGDISFNNVIEASSENKISFMRKMWPWPNQFAIFADLEDGSSLDITEDDLFEMSLYPLPQMGTLSISLYGRGSMQSGYNLGRYHSSDYEGVYYPQDMFDNYSWTVHFTQDVPVYGISYTNSYSGKLDDIPNSLTQLEFSSRQLPTSIEDYQSGCDNENVDVVFNYFYDESQVMYIFGPNNERLHVSKLVDLLKEIYPEHNLTLSKLGSTSFYDYEGITYDQFVTRSTQLNSFKKYQEDQP